MICPQYRCVFVHIPKTAGNSIERVFLGLVGLTWEARSALLLRPNFDPRLGPPRLAHLTAREYVTCGHLTPEEFRSCFKFAFVRNPWDRLVSEYRYRGHPRRIDFKRFLFERFPTPGWTDTWRHVCPQYDFLHDDRGRLLVDFVGRFERLQADFDIVCDRVGIPPTTLPHSNNSRDAGRPANAWQHLKRLKRSFRNREAQHTFPHYTQYYDAESRDYVGQLYRRDIETFHYAFGELPAADMVASVGASIPAGP